MSLRSFIFAFCFLFILENVHIMAKNNVYYSRDGKLTSEKVEFRSGLNFLYSSFVGRFFRPFLSNRYAAKLYALYQDSSLSKRNIKKFIKKHDIDTSEFNKNVEDFTSFNDFFIRELKPGSREVDLNLDAVVSPADSKVLAIKNIKNKTNFFVKNEKFDLEKFLGSKELARKYENGTMFLFRLAPYDYHRYHFPVDSTPKNSKTIGGSFESVNPVAYKSGIQPLTKNERKITFLSTNNFGDIAMVSVGAMFVGRIVQLFVDGSSYKKGDPSGFFKFGGSSVVLIFEPEKVMLEDFLIKNSGNGYETEVRMGQRIAHLKRG